MFNKISSTATITMLLIVGVVATHFVLDSESADRNLPLDISSLPPTAAGGVLDPAGCANLTNAQLRDLGYEPVTANGADTNDDTGSIQATIEAAHLRRRVVYFRPGTYYISDTLRVPSDRNNHRDSTGVNRFGTTMLGSYCGSKKPTIVLKDGVANSTNGVNPMPMVATWKRPDPDVPASATDWRINDGSRHYAATIRNLKFVIGNNAGAVAIHQNSAEGSSLSEVEIDATGGFAGTWSMPGSGGHTYKLTITGGRYGIWAPMLRGGSHVYVGVTLSGQTEAPIAWDHYGTPVFVGADITHNGGPIAVALHASITKIGGRAYPSSISVKPTPTQATQTEKSGRWSIAFVDSKIEVTGGGNPNILETQGPSVYLRNVYVKGSTNIVDLTWGGKLKAQNNSQWFRVAEYAAGRTYNNWNHMEINDSLSNSKVWFNGALTGVSNDVTATEQSAAPAAMISQHFYKEALCNPERSGVYNVADYGADPRDSGDDTAAIQAAIDAAGNNGMVFLPYGGGTTDGKVQEYKITGTLNLKKNTEFCGAARWSSMLDGSKWTTSGSNKPIIRTVDAADAAPIMADFKVEIPVTRGYLQSGFQPHIWGIDWQSGNAVYKDVFVIRTEPTHQGPRANMTIRNNGGGKMFGWTGTNTWKPAKSMNSKFSSNPYTDGKHRFRDKNGNLTLSPEGRILLVKNTVNPLNIYELHCHYVTPPQGALCEFNNTRNVSIFGSKSETAVGIEQRQEVYNYNNAADVPVMTFIKDSSNFVWVGGEGLSEVAQNRAVVEITNSTGVTLAQIGLGRSSSIDNISNRFIVEDDNDNNGVYFGSHLTLFRNSTSIPSKPPGSSTSSEPPSDSTDSSGGQSTGLSVPGGFQLISLE